MSQRRRSITETHERIAQLGWEHDYHQPVIRYPTRYRFPHRAKDPDAPDHARVPADGAREGRAGLRRPRRRRAREHDRHRPRALAGDPRAVHRGHQLRRGRGRALHVDADERGPQRRVAQRLPRTFYARGSAVEHQIEGALATAAEQGLLADLREPWITALAECLQVPAFVEHGLWFALATAARDCLSDTVATCVCLQAAHKQRSAQAIVLYASDLERHLGRALAIGAAREAFLTAPAWQPTRRYLERLAAPPTGARW